MAAQKCTLSFANLFPSHPALKLLSVSLSLPASFLAFALRPLRCFIRSIFTQESKNPLESLEAFSFCVLVLIITLFFPLPSLFDHPAEKLLLKCRAFGLGTHGSRG